MTIRSTYKIEVEHVVNGYEREYKEYVVTVHTDNKGIKNVSGSTLGYSRDYQTPHDSIAVSNFLLEHGGRLKKMDKIRNTSK